jgi:hypothetical protein
MYAPKMLFLVMLCMTVLLIPKENVRLCFLAPKEIEWLLNSKYKYKYKYKYNNNIVRHVIDC